MTPDEIPAAGVSGEAGGACGPLGPPEQQTGGLTDEAWFHRVSCAEKPVSRRGYGYGGSGDGVSS
ncbi:hypothetical protein IMZ48_46675 [Candidatus Bathyarchaeota archaeon]|nr:hypothetical protein [Candidatus Bathyarchaeota archaeon]